MLTETFETLAGFQQDSERNFSAAERIEEAQKPRYQAGSLTLSGRHQLILKRRKKV